MTDHLSTDQQKDLSDLIRRLHKHSTPPLPLDREASMKFWRTYRDLTRQIDELMPPPPNDLS